MWCTCISIRRTTGSWRVGDCRGIWTIRRRSIGKGMKVSGATMGALFISLPGAFAEMGALGQVVGFAFFFTLLVAGLTSSVSLLEVGVASIMDETGMSRRTATLTAGAVTATIGLNTRPA